MISRYSGIDNLREAAAEYAERFRWSVIPIGDRKKPLVKWKQYQDRPATTDEIMKLFADERVAGIGVVCGSVSADLIVRDFDVAGAYERWRTDNPSLAKILPTAKTARGQHVYFRTGQRIATRKFADGELRADGCYVIAPPSLHPDGITYEWLVTPCGHIPVIDASEVDTLSQAFQALHCMLYPEEVVGIPDAIAKTLPTGPGQRNHCVFELARRLRAILPADTDPFSLEPVVKVWHQRALPMIRTKDVAETWTDFIVAWGRVRVPAGATWNSIVERSRRNPYPTITAPIDGMPFAKELMRLCVALQDARPGEPFALPVDKAGKAIGVTGKTAWKYIQLLRAAGDLELVERGSKHQRLAATYRVNLRRGS